MYDISEKPIQLGLCATAFVEPPFTGTMDWYSAYEARHAKDGGETESSVVLGPGQYAINQPGTWHTADVDSEATAEFITAGLGTQHRPR